MGSIERLPDASHVRRRREALFERARTDTRLIDTTELDERLDRDALSLLYEGAGGTPPFVLARDGERTLGIAGAKLGVGRVD